jgi:hypothetical protein
MINTKLQSIIDTKSAIGNAIVNKGGTITGETPFFNYAGEIDNISTGPSAYNGWAVQDVTNAKYTSYDGIIDGTSGGNNTYAFNRWVLNNSTTNSILLSNTVMETSTDVIVNIDSENQANMAFINSTNAFSGDITGLVTNDGFIFGAGKNEKVLKYNENNLSFITNTVDAQMLGVIRTITINNGFVYVGSDTNTSIRRYYETNLAFEGNTAAYGGEVRSVKINNGFIYAGGATNQTVHKYYESNLAFVGNTVGFGGDIDSLAINNGFIYASGRTNLTVQKFYESNLAFVGATNSYGGTIFSITTNNGFIYAGGFDEQITFTGKVKKFHESNLAYDSNANSYGHIIHNLTTDNGFVYVGGRGNATANRDVKKYHESNLVFVGNTNNYGGDINTITINNGFLYAGGESNRRIQKFQTAETVFNNTSLYEIKSLKED